MRYLERTVLWRSLEGPGLEYCGLWREDDARSLEGAVIGVLHHRPLIAEYVVRCNSGWETRSVEVRLRSGEQERALHLWADTERHWWDVSGELVELRGCVDVDLAISPGTNTLPIRRLALSQGESAKLIAAWVRFPDLTVEPLHQRYTRLSTGRYRYESGGDYTAEIEVDDMGLVNEYEGAWARLATAPPLEH